MENSTENEPVNQRPLSFKEWTLNIFLAGLPLIGLILLLVWAFSSEGNVHRKAWAKGMLLLYVIAIALFIVFSLIFGIGMASFIGSQN